MHRWILATAAGAALLAAPAVPARGQDSTRDSTARQPDSAAAVDTTPLTPEQQRYIDGLRTAARGVAQLKDGIDRVTRAAATGDADRLRRAGRLLGGWCGTARTFIAQGRPRMDARVFEEPRRTPSRALAVQIDSVTQLLPACQREALQDPKAVAQRLFERITKYEGVVAQWRAAFGLANR